MIRNIRNDYGVGADAGMGPDGDRADDLGACADEHMIAKARAAAAVGSNGDLVLDMNPRATLHLPVDDDAARVNEDEAGAELGTAPDDAAVARIAGLTKGSN